MTGGQLAWCVAATVISATVSAADPDPNLEAVQTVCGRCHTTAVFLDKPRSWDRWNDVFADMTQRGANGTDEQLGRVTAYFLENLTFVNVNTSPADEIAGVLGVADDVARAIVASRHLRRAPRTTATPRTGRRGARTDGRPGSTTPSAGSRR